LIDEKWVGVDKIKRLEEPNRDGWVQCKGGNGERWFIRKTKNNIRETFTPLIGTWDAMTDLTGYR